MKFLRETILSARIHRLFHSPLLRPDVCDLEQVSKAGETTYGHVFKLAGKPLVHEIQSARSFNLQCSQLASIEAALTRRMTMIQGP
jgi:hypothetical protein